MRTYRGSAVVLCFLFVTTIKTARGAEPAVTIERIEQAWAQREAKVASFEIRWKAVVTQASSIVPTPANKDRISKEDMHGDRHYHLVMLRDRKYRLDEGGLHYVPEPNEYDIIELLTVFDGRLLKVRRRKDPTGRDRWPEWASLSAIQETLPSEQLVPCKPLLLLYWPGLPSFAQFAPRHFELREVSEILPDGRKCAVLDNVSEREWQVLYLDIELDFVPVRFLRYSATTKEILSEWNLEVEHHLDGIPRLRGWHQSDYKEDGQLFGAEEAGVDSLMLNVTPPVITFDTEIVALPVGTLVNNHITDEYYVLESGGVKRHVTGLTQKEIDRGIRSPLHRPPPSAKADAGEGTWLNWLLGPGGVLCSIALIGGATWYFLRIRVNRR